MPKDTHSVLGANIKKYREHRGYTQDELSDRAGIAYSTVAKLEQGAIINPSLNTLLSLANALQVDVDLLFKSDDAQSVQPIENKIKFIYLDINGVLVKFYLQAFRTLSYESGMSLIKIEQYFWYFNELCDRGEISIEEFNAKFSKAIGLESFDWRKYYFAGVEPNTGIHSLLTELQTRYKLGILTNSFKGSVDQLIKQKLIPNIKYEVIINSAEVGMAKPDKDIFELAEKRSGFSGQEILLVDDRMPNILAAGDFGWQAVWFDILHAKSSVDKLKEALLS